MLPPSPEERIGEDKTVVSISADETQVLQTAQCALEPIGFQRELVADPIARHAGLSCHEANDTSVHVAQHVEVDSEEVADHAIGGHLLNGLVQPAGFEEALADQLNEVGMVVAVGPNGLGHVVRDPGAALRVEVRLANQQTRFIIGQSLDVQRRREPVQERRRVGVLVGQRPQTYRGCQDRADVLATLHRVSQFAQ